MLSLETMGLIWSSIYRKLQIVDGHKIVAVPCDRPARYQTHQACRLRPSWFSSALISIAGGGELNGVAGSAAKASTHFTVNLTARAAGPYGESDILIFNAFHRGCCRSGLTGWCNAKARRS